MTQRTHTLAILVLAAALGASSTAAAQPVGAQAPAADPAAKAEALFREGLNFVRHQQWADAEQKFLAAWTLNPTADVAVNLGQTQYNLGKLREAAGYLAFAVKHWPLIGKKDPRDNAKITLAELRRLLGSLTVQVSVPGAMVSVDGTSVGRAPLELEVFVDPGSHTVTAKLDEYDDATLSVQAEKGSSQTVTLTMMRAAPPPPPLPRNEEPSPAPPPPRLNKAVLISGGAITGVGIILGTAFAIVSNAKASEAAANHDAIQRIGVTAACGPTPSADCQALESAGKARATFANASAWSFIAGGAVGAATVIYALAAPRAATGSGTRVVPLVGTGGGGVIVQGEW